MAKNSKDLHAKSVNMGKKILGENLSFAASEAYKLLRTNLAFSLPSEGKCRVIGITSALSGEGKSTTSLNLALTIAQEGRRVLLVEADLRLPTVAKRLSISAKPGLSNLLVGQCSGNDVLQKCPVGKNVYVITAGDIPPNPSELLNSAQMQQTIEALSGVFDTIIVDLPPVTVVADALVVSKLLDGIILVVREKYCTRRILADMMRQMKVVDTKLLGFVVTGSDIQKKNYKKYGKSYDKYGKSYDSASTATRA